MNKCWAVILTSWLASNVGLAAESQVSRCRAISDAAARLACYDALELPKDSEAPIARERLPEAGVAPPESIETHIPGVFEGWQPRTRIRLANGQVWQVTDDSSGSYRLVDPKVTLRRGMMGSFFLELTSENRSIRVRRTE